MKYFANFNTISYDINGDGSTREIANIFRKVKINPIFLDDITFYTYYTILNGERPDTASFKLYGKVDYHWTFQLLNPWLVDMQKDWPMDSIELNHYIEEKYPYKSLIIDDIELASKYQVGETLQGLVSGATATVLSKDVNLKQITIDNLVGNFADGEIVYGQTSEDYLTLVSQRDQQNAIHHYELTDGEIVDRFTVGAQAITNYEYESILNEEHTKIKVIRPELIQTVTKKFIDVIKV